MCRCAFELLRSDRASVALDFRDFARRNGSGARAVSLQGTTNDKLVYCRSSERTMAISHVWSHGQGGRPERSTGTGFNRCLHDRYARIARSFGCDSYWMDTPCIPQDHRLRDEAIQNINRVFRDSRLTLVCDRDVQLIDASRPSLAVHERILAVLLVCDWNARAWTLLEAMRGRHDVWLLCRHDVPVSFRAALDDVHRRGSVALATLFLTAQHLLPSFRPVKAAQRESMRAMVRGLVSVEEAAMLLSHRHATRPGDEIVIWSLLVGETVPEDALDFWRRNLIVRTGFLVSSVPRLDKLGWSWAPVRPDMPEEGYRKGRDKLVFHQDGVKTEFADVVDDGLDAPWFVGEFPGRRAALEGYL
ncbi:hypothetical protein NA56DRAFT_752534 [Neofusicoccum parvum]|nr:hypothetical protein NA56DRAFT_752534 [Neofusicoccum parvum]